MSKKDYSAITGVSLRRQDLQNWTDAHFIAWFKVVHHFTIDGKFSFTELGINSFKSQAKEQPFWEEWMYRTEANLRDYNLSKISSRILNTTRVVGLFLQNNPHIITTQMRGMMEASPYLAKYAEPFTVETSDIGASIIKPNTDDLSKFTLPEVQYHKAMLKMANIADELLGSITKGDIKKMSPKDRISLANTLLGTMSRVQGGHKPNTQIFKQLIIHQAGRQELESAMLELTKDHSS